MVFRVSEIIFSLVILCCLPLADCSAPMLKLDFFIPPFRAGVMNEKMVLVLFITKLMLSQLFFRTSRAKVYFCS